TPWPSTYARGPTPRRAGGRPSAERASLRTGPSHSCRLLGGSRPEDAGGGAGEQAASPTTTPCCRSAAPRRRPSMPPRVPLHDIGRRNGVVSHLSAKWLKSSSNASCHSRQYSSATFLSPRRRAARANVG